MARGLDAIDSTPETGCLMVVLLPFMILGIFYILRATVKIIIFMFSLIAVIFGLTIKTINLLVPTRSK